jgi:hypothetical protein
MKPKNKKSPANRMRSVGGLLRKHGKLNITSPLKKIKSLIDNRSRDDTRQ